MSTRNRKRISAKAGQRRSRVGAAMVELAVCLPLLVFLVIGSMDVCDLIFLRNSLVNSAYIGTLEIRKFNATDASIRSLMTQSLDASRVRNYQVSITGPNAATFDASPKTSLIRVQVSAPISANLRIGRLTNLGSTVTVNVVGVK